MGLLVVFGLYAIGLLWATHPVSELSISKAASFGDSFGVITSLFAGLGFAGLLATIFLQREELKLTRRELQETKQTLTRQRFEESFYRMLEFCRRNLEDIVVNSREKPSRQLRGLDALAHLNRHFTYRWDQLNLKKPRSDSRNDCIAYADRLASMVRDVYVRQARYVDTLNNVLTLINEECESPAQKPTYLRVFCSQLTSVELIYLFYQAYVHPNFGLLREVLCSDPAFSERVAMLHQIPDEHRQAWNLLYPSSEVRRRQTGYPDTIPQTMKDEAEVEILTLDEQIQHARPRSRAQRDPQ
jgi:hypothetical protein